MPQKRMLGGFVLVIIALLALPYLLSWRAHGQGNNVAVVSAASFTAPVAPDSIAAAFGAGLALQTQAATAQPLPTNLAGTTLKLNGLLAPLFFVSANQVNFLVPAATAPGTANLEVRVNDNLVATGTVQVSALAPALFMASQAEPRAPAGNLLRVRADGIQVYEQLAQRDPVTGKIVGNVIDMGPEGERVFLVLYFTGLRRAAPQHIRLLIGNTQVIPAFAGPSPSLAGIEQLNAQIPRSLIPNNGLDGVPLELALVVNGTLYGQGATITIKPLRNAEDTQVQLSGFAPLPALAGAQLEINGAGFIPNLIGNQVFITDGLNKATEAQVIAATTGQLRVLVPFGAVEGQALISTPRGEKRSTEVISLRTSISGFVQDTQRQGLGNVTVRLPGTAFEARTDANGSFVIADMPAAAKQELEIDPTATGLNYPKVRTSLRVQAKRDNQLTSVPELKLSNGAGFAPAAAPLSVAQVFSTPVEFATPDNAAQLQTGNVTLELPPGAVVRCPDNSTNCPLTLTPFERGRTPADLPPGHFSSTIVQITPFGATISCGNTPCGGKLIFPNSDNLPAGSTARLFKFDQTPDSNTLGSFIDIGPATVSVDGQRIETAANAIIETSYYFVSALRPTTLLTGYVSEADGRPVRRAIVQARGQTAFTNNLGGFALAGLPVLSSNDQVTIEVSFMRPDKTIDRTQRSGVPLKIGTSDPVTPELVLPMRANNRVPLIIAPNRLALNAGETRAFDFIATDPDEGQTVTVLPPTGATFASVQQKDGAVFTLQLAPAANATGSYIVNLLASDGQANSTHAVEVMVNPANNAALIAHSQAVATNEDAAQTITLAGSGPVGQALGYVVFTAPARGKLSGTPPKLTYTPDRDYHGLDSFTFKVQSGAAESNAATVFIAIKPVNDAPVLNVSGGTTVNGGETLSLELSATDVDTGQVMRFAKAAGSSLPPGAAIIHESETSARLVWTPSLHQAGAYNINLRVTDNGAPPLTSPAQSVTLTVTARWAKTSGPEGGAHPALLSVGGVLYTGTSKGGIYRSLDQGQTWAAGNRGLEGRALTATALAVAGDTLFAGTFGGLYRSTDGGQSWARAGSSGLPDVPVFALLADGNQLYAGTGDLIGSGVGIFRSMDNGATWQALNNGLRTGNRNITAIVKSGNNVFAATGHLNDATGSGGLYRLNAAGDGWVSASTGITVFGVTPPVSTLLPTSNGLYAAVIGAVVFGTTVGGVFRSTDNGSNWTPIRNGLTGTALLVTSLAFNQGTLFVGTFGAGIYRFNNSSQSWSPSNAGLTDYALFVLRLLATENGTLLAGTSDEFGRGGGLYRSTNNGASWQLRRSGITASLVQSMLVTNDSLYVGTAENGIQRSTDNGQSWTPVNNGLVGDALVVYALAADQQTLYAGTLGDGVYRSTDKGQNWTPLKSGLTGLALRVFGLAVSGGEVFAGTEIGVYRLPAGGQSWQPFSSGLSGNAAQVSELLAVNGVLYAGTSDGVYRRAAGAQSWARANGGLSGDALYVQAILATNNGLLIGTYGGGVYRSTDGENWTPGNQGLTGEALNVFSLEQLGNSIFLGTAALNEGGEGIFRSTDGGQSWQPFKQVLGDASVYTMVSDGRQLFAGTFGNGVFVLTDSAQSWTESNHQLGNRFINATAVKGATIFAGTLGGGLFRSTDQGQSWTVANGTPPTALPTVASVQTIATNDTTVFAGLFGQGVYRSGNDGQSWAEINTGLPVNADQTRNPRNVNALKFSGAALFAATDGGVFRFDGNNWGATGLTARTQTLLVNGPTIYAGTFDDGVHRSINQGQSWERINQNLGSLAIISLGASADGAHIFAGTENGVYRFNAQTQSWTAANQNLPTRLPVFGFAVVGEKLYAGSVYGVFLSSDNGASWKQLNAGLLDIYVTSLAVSGKQLIAGTRVGGVFVSQLP